MKKNITVEYAAIYREGVSITDAQLNLDAGEVFDIETSDAARDFDWYIAEGIIYDCKFYILEKRTEFLSDAIFNEFKMNNPDLCSKTD